MGAWSGWPAAASPGPGSTPRTGRAAGRSAPRGVCERSSPAARSPRIFSASASRPAWLSTSARLASSGGVSFSGEQRERLVVALVLREGVGLQEQGLEADALVAARQQRAQGGLDLVPLLAVVIDLGDLEVRLLRLLGLAVLRQVGGEPLQQGRRVAAPAGALQHPRQGDGHPRLAWDRRRDLAQQGDARPSLRPWAVRISRAGG